MMVRVIHILYNIVAVPLLACVYGLLVVFHKKTRKRFRGVRASLHSPELKALHSHTSVAWFHAASMGEFEQAKPVIEALKARNSSLKIVVSFSSPSGYEPQRNYAAADAVMYLPFDSWWSMRALVQSLQPAVFVCIRYDLWWNLLFRLRLQRVPVVLLNATYTRSRILSAFPLRQIYHCLLRMCSVIQTANEVEYKRFAEMQLNMQLNMKLNMKLISGTDTRYDRILATARSEQQHEPWFENFAGNALENSANSVRPLVVALGSVWHADRIQCGISEEFLAQNPHIRLLIVPHEIDEKTLATWQEHIPECARLSLLRASTITPHFRHVLVDTMGELLRLYRHADVAYVGGGFGSGVHSVAEPAAYGIPVACGPHTANSADVVRLSAHNGCRIVTGAQEFALWLQSMNSALLREQVGAANKDALEKAAGSTETAVATINSYVR
ncbi:MAG: 3-deoxy-D-manno-octulosonic acid transferase [Candidatus Kapaibacterium sp.]